MNKFATLTLDLKKIPKGMSSDVFIRDCWRKMRVYLFRAFGESVDYIATLEFQENGRAHLHLLLNKFVKQVWLSQAWAAVGGGHIVDIRYADIHRVTAYLSIYLTGKKIEGTLKRLKLRARIFTTSRSVRLWPKKKPSGGFLRRVEIGKYLDSIPEALNIKFKPQADLPSCLGMLVSFESPLVNQVLGTRNPLEVLRGAIPHWQYKKPLPRLPANYQNQIQKGELNAKDVGGND